MNKNQENILVELVKLHLIQEKDGPYFDPLTGGVYSSDLVNFVGLGWVTIEDEALQLEKDGYLVLLNRKDGSVEKGLQANDKAVDWYKTKLADDFLAQQAADALAQQMEDTRLAQISLLEKEIEASLADWDKADKDLALKNLAQLKLLG